MDYLIDSTNSSLIEGAVYNDETELLYILFSPHYYVKALVYCEVPVAMFVMFSEANSLGKFYLTYIKNKFKTTVMADKPKGINKCKSDGKRFIKMSINVRKIKKEWIEAGEKGDYLKVTLHLLPDGELDAYDNLGLITQDVPQKLAKENKELRGEILGNGFEFAPKELEGQPGQSTGKTLTKEEEDDLPF